MSDSLLLVTGEIPMEYPDYESVFYTKQIRRCVYEKKLIDRLGVAMLADRVSGPARR